jgi:hypothetical protein
MVWRERRNDDLVAPFLRTSSCSGALIRANAMR